MMFYEKTFMYSRLVGHGFMGGWSWLIGLGLVLVIGAIIYLAVNKHRQSNNKAVSELDKMLVEGEISEEDYLKKKSVLKGK